MKRFLPVLLAAVLLLSAAALAETRITVNGEGKVSLEADSAVVTLGVSVDNEDVRAAQETANENVASIRAALTDAGIPDGDINTDNIMISPSYSWENTADTVYSATSTLAVRVSDIGRIGEVIDLALEAGANSLNAISYFSGQEDSAGQEALKAAAAQAKTKAEVIAQAEGLTITGIEEVNESYLYTSDRTATDIAEAKSADSGSTVVQSAGLIVTAQITVTYAAE